MSSSEARPTRRAGLRLAALVLCLLLAGSAWSQAPGAASQPEVWLVTYGPGEVYWQRFGHNAIWIRDPALGLDHSFNFGFFDFKQERFFLRFLQGRMLYFSAAQAAGDEFAQYLAEGRGIRAQRLALEPPQRERLTRSLLTQVRPENRDYLYDYYLKPCPQKMNVDENGV